MRTHLVVSSGSQLSKVRIVSVPLIIRGFRLDAVGLLAHVKLLTQHRGGGGRLMVVFGVRGRAPVQVAVLGSIADLSRRLLVNGAVYVALRVNRRVVSLGAGHAAFGLEVWFLNRMAHSRGNRRLSLALTVLIALARRRGSLQPSTLLKQMKFRALLERVLIWILLVSFVRRDGLIRAHFPLIRVRYRLPQGERKERE